MAMASFPEMRITPMAPPCAVAMADCILRVHESCLLFQKLPVVSVVQTDGEGYECLIGHRYSVAAIRLTISSNPLRSVSSKLSALSLSMSNTPFITLLYMIGITISERDSLLHAICPGKKIHIGHYQRACLLPCRTADTTSFPDTVAGNASLERPECEFLFGFHQIKPYPEEPERFFPVQPPCWPLRLFRPVLLR